MMRVKGWCGVAIFALGLAPAGAGAAVTCDVEMSQEIYYRGDTVTAQSLRIVNGGGEEAARIVVSLKVPGGKRLTLADVSRSLPAGLDQTIGPKDLSLVTPDLPEGAYTLVVSINRPSGGALAYDEDPFEVYPNRRPQADAGPDATVYPGDTVTLDGSGSSDADGDPLTYRWRLTKVPAGSSAALSDTSAVRPTFRADLRGDYVAELVVSDGRTDSLPDTVTVTSSFPKIELGVALARIVYDQVMNRAFGLDSVNKQVLLIDLTAKKLLDSVDLTYTPSDGCLSPDGRYLYLVNYGTTWITRVDLTLKSEETVFHWDKEFWGGHEENFIHYHLACGENRLFIVDGNWAPALRVVDLNTYEEVKTSVDEVGDLVFSQDGTDLYTWQQYGWSAGLANTNVHRFAIDGLSFEKIDSSSLTYPAVKRDPLDTPIFLDKAGGRVVTKPVVLNALNLQQVLYTFPEDIYAVQFDFNLAAGKKAVYSLATYDKVGDVPVSDANQMFYDALGTLFLLANKDSALYYFPLP